MTEIASQDDFRSGFVSFVGRPNVGKSSLTNALAEQKIAITSSKPQTTRKAIRVIVNTDSSQIILVDTPGVHRPRTLLGERLNTLVEDTLGGVDIIGFCVPANEDIGPGDRFINEQLDDYPNTKKIAIVTKIDTVGRDRVVDQLAMVDQLRDWDAVIPVAEDDRKQLAELKNLLSSLLPVSQALYPAEVITEESPQSRYAELIREAALEDVHDELPHSLAVTIEEVIEGNDGELSIYANIIVERDSQKGIIIGHKGSQIKKIRKKSRAEIEKIIGRPVTLSLRVTVLKEWQRDPKFLRRLGF
ncbi:MAG TPA: GTPase Era [Microbacteriaceae bacterium]|nr:GTPase Era [Microbacteriaceae bacterium]